MRPRGFTLIELLVALVMLSMVMVLAYSSLNTSVKTIERREARAQLLHRGHFILRHVTEHLQSVHVERDAFYRMGAGADAPVFVGEPNALSFWTRSQAHARRRQSDGLVRLEYAMADSVLEEDAAAGLPAGGEDQTTLQVEIYSDLTLTPEPDAQWALPVEAVEFEYFNGETWTSFWDVETEKRLPTGVRVSLTLTDEQNQESPLILSTTIPLHVTTAIAFEPAEETETVDTPAEAITDPEDPDAQ